MAQERQSTQRSLHAGKHELTVDFCEAGGGEVGGWELIEVDRIWGIWGSYYNMPNAIFYLLKGDYRV